MCSSPFVVYPSFSRPLPGMFVLLLLSRLSGQSVRTIAVCPEVAPPGGERGGRGRERVEETGGGSLEVSLTILRNFADSLARVDHVRPVLRSHGSCREGETGFRVGAKGLKEDRTREANRTRLRRGHGWRAPRVVSSRCPKICIRDGYADWKRDVVARASQNILFPAEDPCSTIPLARSRRI